MTSGMTGLQFWLSEVRGLQPISRDIAASRLSG